MSCLIENIEKREGDTPLTAARRALASSAPLKGIMRKNSYAGFMCTVLGMEKAFGAETLKKAALPGTEFNHFLSETFGVRNPDKVVRSLLKKPPGVLGKIAVGRDQIKVNGVISPAARAAGVHADLMRGTWGLESTFSNDKGTSHTGCTGPWQFSTVGFRAVTNKRSFRETLRNEQGHAIRPGQDLRRHPVVSTYAAAQYMKDIGKDLGLDPTKPEDFGRIFAGYNLGMGNARKLMKLADNNSQVSAASVIGSAARNNPVFFSGGATAAEVLDRYDAYVYLSIRSYRKNILANIPGAQARAQEEALREAADRFNKTKPGYKLPDGPPALRNKYGENKDNHIRLRGPFDKARDHTGDKTLEKSSPGSPIKQQKQSGLSSGTTFNTAAAIVPDEIPPGTVPVPGNYCAPGAKA